MKKRENLSSPLAEYLYDIFEKRKSRNEKYSLRAFARDLDVSPARLCEILAGKYNPGHQLVEKMVFALKMDRDQQNHFWSLVEEHSKIFRKTSGARIVERDELEILIDYDHYSLLNLMETDDFKSDLVWMANRLGVTETKLQQILDRLLSRGFIKKSSFGSYKPTYKKVTTTQDFTCEHLQEAHRRLIDHALKSIAEDPIDKRDVTSITFAMDRKQLSEAKEIIRDFRRRMANLFESGPKNEVYNLNIQLVPVTK
ncbi:DUF4423 domain-containing protein [Bdellovibrio sp. HCB337]|uniref:DUF4423 domain-containing protein n=1 Tax=Bdellovibrio sp. HCB337 TaxID=3394358 RepID=UPI0039A6965E